MPRLEQWSIAADQWSAGYVLPSSEIKFLRGLIFDDAVRPDRNDLVNKKFTDGDFVYTSMVKTVDLTNMKAQTHNTLYELGTPSAEYLAFLEKKGVTLVQLAALQAT